MLEGVERSTLGDADVSNNLSNTVVHSSTIDIVVIKNTCVFYISLVHMYSTYRSTPSNYITSTSDIVGRRRAKRPR